MGERARHGDGVLGGSGTVDGRPVFCYAQDPGYAGGSLGEAHADTIVRVLELAERGRAPVVGLRLLGRRPHAGGHRRPRRLRADLPAHRRAVSGKVPQISIVTGLSAGGGAYSPALTDWVVMTEESSMFLTGPGVVREALGEDVDAEKLGGAKVHATQRGLPLRRARRHRRRDARPRPARLPAQPPRARPLPHVRRRPPSGADPESIVPAAAAPGLRRPRRDRRDRRRRRAARGLSRLGAQPGHRVRPHRRPDGRRDRQPAALPRRRARRGQLREGRAVRHQVRRLRDPAAGARRHARVHAGHATGGGRRHPRTARRSCTRSRRRPCRGSR